MDFLKLIEKKYKNKIINNYWTGGILYKGKFKLTINDNIELYTCDTEGFCFKYNDKILKVKFNQKIFDKMVETMEEHYDITVSQELQ